MQTFNLDTLSSKSPSRRRMLASAGGAALGLACLGKTAIASAIVDSARTNLTAASFTPFIDGYFKVFNGGEAMPTLKLVKVLLQSRGNRPASLRDPFSLILASQDGLQLAAEVYRVQLPDQRWMEMFLSPISADSMRYEAAFN
jgi:hypothetical protein